MADGTGLDAPADAPAGALADALLAACPDALFLLSDDGTLTWANAAAERLTGITLVDGVGLNALTFVHPDDAEIAALALVSMQTKAVGTLLELRIDTEHGWKLVEVRGAAVGDRVLMSVRDLTDRRRWEVAHDEDARLRALVQYSASLTFLLTADGAVQTSSSGLSRLLAVDQEWLENKPLGEIVDPADRAAVDTALRDVATDTEVGARRSLAVRLLRGGAGATSVPFALTITNLLADPTVNGLVVTGHDITDRVTAEEHLRTANSLLGATLEATADGILVVGIDGQVRSWNSRFVEMWHIDEDLLRAGDNRTALASVVRNLREPETFLAKIEDLYAAPESHSHDVLHFLDGRVIERDSLPQRINGEVVGRVWSFRDVTEQNRLQHALAHQALHDRLTGLANQALFRDRVEHAARRRQDPPRVSAVMFIDLDNFKDVNDSLGHAAGDALLVAVTQRLTAHLRPSDTAARLGGDEFAVLIDDVTDVRAVAEVAERLLDAIREPLVVAGKQVSTTASIGIAFSTTGGDADSMLRNADLAMYSAKAAGKGCTRVYAPAMHREVLERLDLEQSLRGAVARGELLLHYQPIVELRTGRIVALEALVRWQHPERGLLGPDVFIPLAERSGLISEVGEFVLQTACAEAVAWQRLVGRHHVGPAVSVNLSPTQLLDLGLADRMIELLDEIGLSPDQLILEITEGAIMHDPGTVAGALDRLRRLGVQLAVDDFGTGYSSLAYLHQFPLHILKIDRAFVSEVHRDGTTLAHAVVQLAHTLELTPIAEGVESQIEADALIEMGCELAQGFHLGRPVPAADARVLIAATARPAADDALAS
jgi:diguanylate cyclase (GGDEF)-like protein